MVIWSERPAQYGKKSNTQDMLFIKHTCSARYTAGSHCSGAEIQSASPDAGTSERWWWLAFSIKQQLIQYCTVHPCAKLYIAKRDYASL